jgi:hypothetical protein
VTNEPYLLIWDGQLRAWVDVRELDSLAASLLAWRADRIAAIEIDVPTVEAVPFDPDQAVSPTLQRGGITVSGSLRDRLAAAVWVMSLDLEDEGTKQGLAGLGCSSFVEGTERNFILMAGGDPNSPPPTPGPGETPTPTPGPTNSPPPPPPSPSPDYGSVSRAFLSPPAGLLE